MTIAEVLLRYYEGHAKHKPSADSTKIHSRYWMDFYGDEAVISDLTSSKQEEFHNFLLGRGYSKSYADKIIDTGIAALNRAVKKQQIASFPPIETFLTKEEIEAAAPKVDHWNSKNLGALW